MTPSTCISAVPLGGYVKMAGETPEDARTGSSDEFLSKSKWQRFQVLVMGPVMNLGLAIIVMAIVLLQGARLPAFEDQQVLVGGLRSRFCGSRPRASRSATASSAWTTRPCPTGASSISRSAPKAKRPVRLGIERDGKRIEREVVPAAVDKYETGAIGVMPVTHPQIAETRVGQPGAEGGLLPGDVVMGAGGEANVSRERLIELIQASDSKPLALNVVRGGAPQTITVVPRVIDGGVRIGATITSLELKVVEPGVVEAFELSLKQNWEWTTMIFETLGGLFTRQTSVKQLMGPVAIASLSGDAAQQDSWIPLFTLMAMISLNLGLLNLMPIPVLDGGHIAILALEGVSRRDFSMKVKEKMLLAGFVLLLMLMVTVIYNDLMRIQWIERLVPWR